MNHPLPPLVLQGDKEYSAVSLASPSLCLSRCPQANDLKIPNAPVVLETVLKTQAGLHQRLKNRQRHDRPVLLPPPAYSSARLPR